MASQQSRQLARQLCENVHAASNIQQLRDIIMSLASQDPSQAELQHLAEQVATLDKATICRSLKQILGDQLQAGDTALAEQLNNITEQQQQPQYYQATEVMTDGWGPQNYNQSYQTAGDDDVATSYGTQMYGHEQNGNAPYGCGNGMSQYDYTNGTNGMNAAPYGCGSGQCDAYGYNGNENDNDNGNNASDSYGYGSQTYGSHGPHQQNSNNRSFW